MAVPALSGPSTGGGAAGLNVVPVTHIADGSAVYAIVVGTTFTGFGGQNDFAVTCTLDGAPMERWVSWYSVNVSDVMRVWIFTLPSVAAGSKSVVFTAPALGGSEQYRVIVANCADGCAHAGVVLPGGYYNFTGTTSLTKTAYGWADGGLQVTLALGTGATISPGTLFASVDTCVVYTEPTTDAEIAFTASRPVSGRLGMFSFCIPPATQFVSGGTCYPMFTAMNDSGGIASAGTAIGTMGLPYGVFAGSRLINVLPVPGTVRAMAFGSSIALAAGQTVRCEIVRGGHDCGVAGAGTAYTNRSGVYVDLVGPLTTVSLDGIALPFNGYEQLGLALTYQSGAGAMAAMSFTATLLIEPDATGRQMYGGGNPAFASMSIGAQALRSLLHPMDVNWGIFPNSQKSLFGIDATIEELLGTYQTDTDLDPDYQYYLSIDSVLQDGSGATVDTEATLVPNTMNRSYARSRFTLPVAPGQFGSCANYLRHASSATLRHAATIVVRPTTRGQFMLSGHTAVSGGGTFNATANSADNGDSVVIANEIRATHPVPPMTFTGDSLHIDGMIADLDGTSPGGANSLRLDLRKNAAATSMPQLVIAAPSTAGTTGGDEPYVGEDRIGVRWTPTGTYSRQFWSIPGHILAAPLPGSIVVEKDAGGNVTQLFDFVAGGLTPGTFSLAGGQTRTFPNLTPGSGYSVEEVNLPIGWQLTSAITSNGSPITAISVGDGELVTVTFLNRAGQAGCPIPNQAAVSGQNACPSPNPTVI